jgi:hypothetical protein
MGYECPVCGTPQADARHLANHLAFTAVLGREDHEAWLDEHAPGWSEAGEAELAPRVAEHAPETEFDQLFEDTAGGLEGREDPAEPAEERSGALFDELPTSPEHDHDQGRTHAPRESHLAGGVDEERLDPETRAVIEEARDLTREMLADEDEETEETGTADETAAGDDTDNKA